MTTALDLAGLLHQAATDGGLEAQWAWYRAVAMASPFWTRQQTDYEQSWGGQTTDAKGVTPWRVMSQRLEAEAPFRMPIGLARLCLEVIARISGPENMTPERLDEILQAQRDDNLAEASQRMRQAADFFEQGAPRDELRTVKKQILGSQFRRGGIPLRPDQVQIIVKDARPWVKAVAELARQGLLPKQDDDLGPWQFTLPFLDSVEVAASMEKARVRSWRSHAVFLLQRRLAGFSDGQVAAATLFEYAFGRSEAASVRARRTSS